MVPNQRQLFIVVSDWGSYLGRHFCTTHINFTVRFVILFVCSVFFHSIKKNVHIARCTLVSFV